MLCISLIRWTYTFMSLFTKFYKLYANIIDLCQVQRFALIEKRQRAPYHVRDQRVFFWVNSCVVFVYYGGESSETFLVQSLDNFSFHLRHLKLFYLQMRISSHNNDYLLDCKRNIELIGISHEDFTIRTSSTSIERRDS